jgi:hypothetical protein
MIKFDEKIFTNKIFDEDKTIVVGSPEEYGIEVTKSIVT